MAKYKGVLAKRFEALPIGFGFSPEMNIGFIEYAAEREAALFEHYEIDTQSKNCWRDLALSLAEDHVPAYSRTQGRPSKNLSEDLSWYNLFWAYKKRHKCSDSEAYRLISERPEVELDAEKVKDRLKAFSRREVKSANFIAYIYKQVFQSPDGEERIDEILAPWSSENDSDDYAKLYEQQFSRYPYFTLNEVASQSSDQEQP